MKFIISSLVVSLVVNGTSAQELLEAEPVKGLTQLQEDEAAPEAAAEEPAAEVPDAGDADVSVKKVPFTHPVMESIGCVLMWMLIALSNAGGLSGAGSNIPIMLIFFSLDMSEAVPISAFVAVCATVFRFILNFNQRHPKNPERVAINYEIVQLTMPCVFLGSFLGIMLGKAIGPDAQMIIFGITVAWSIQTTTKKAIQLLAKEKEMEGKESSNENLLTADAPADDDQQIEGITPELKEIKYQEKYHFTGARLFFIAINFCALFVTQFLTGGKGGFELPPWGKNAVLFTFIVTMLLATVWGVMNVNKIHEIKARDGYKFDANDTKFEKVSDIAKLAFFCMIAAVLCGCTGIAGGMVLGPLFLKYNMIPSVMSGTNQYITMIASLSVAIQFMYIGAMNFEYAFLFGALTLIAAYTGITAVNIYVKRSGK